MLWKSKINRTGRRPVSESWLDDKPWKGEIPIAPFQGLARAAYSNSLGVAQRYWFIRLSALTCRLWGRTSPIPSSGGELKPQVEFVVATLAVALELGFMVIERSRNMIYELLVTSYEFLIHYSLLLTNKNTSKKFNCVKLKKTNFKFFINWVTIT